MHVLNAREYLRKDKILVCKNKKWVRLGTRQAHCQQKLVEVWTEIRDNWWSFDYVVNVVWTVRAQCNSNLFELLLPNCMTGTRRSLRRCERAREAQTWKRVDAPPGARRFQERPWMSKHLVKYGENPWSTSYPWELPKITTSWMARG